MIVLFFCCVGAVVIFTGDVRWQGAHAKRLNYLIAHTAVLLDQTVAIILKVIYLLSGATPIFKFRLPFLIILFFPRNH